MTLFRSQEEVYNDVGESMVRYFLSGYNSMKFYSLCFIYFICIVFCFNFN